MTTWLPRGDGGVPRWPVCSRLRARPAVKIDPVQKALGRVAAIHDADFTDLERQLSGEVLAPGSPAYDQARKPRMTRFHGARPRAIVLCASPDDVAQALAWARRLGLPVAPRGGGHCHAGRSSTDGVVIDVTPMRAVEVSGSVATVGAGLGLGELYRHLHEHGIALPGGCGETVGIAGLTLGGGIGILGRRYGLTCDQLRGAQVVLADGRIVDCDDRHHHDLFWALRGAGGGQFGIVTSLVFHVVPAPLTTAFQVTWPYRHAQAVIAAWQTWAPDAPDEVNASLRLVKAGARSPAISMFGAALASEDATREALEQMIAASGAEPASSSLAELPYHDAKRSLSALDQDPMAVPHHPDLYWSRSEFFHQQLPSSAIAALLWTFANNQPPEQSRELVFTPMGGAYNRVPADASAFVHRQERFLLESIATLPAHASRPSQDRAHGWTTRSWASVHPWASGRTYPNFPNPDLADWAESYHGTNYTRLLAIKREYDPENIFSFQQSLRC